MIFFYFSSFSSKFCFFPFKLSLLLHSTNFILRTMSRNLIKKLLKSYNSRDILTDEAKIDFNASERKHDSYGPPPSAGTFNHHGDFYSPTIANQ